MKYRGTKYEEHVYNYGYKVHKQDWDDISILNSNKIKLTNIYKICCMQLFFCYIMYCTVANVCKSTLYGSGYFNLAAKCCYHPNLAYVFFRFDIESCIIISFLF